jgi:hypothetical protein
VNVSTVSVINSQLSMPESRRKEHMHAEPLAPIPRRDELDVRTFMREYAARNQPVIVSGANFWDGEPLTIEWLRARYGDRRLDQLTTGNGASWVGVHETHVRTLGTFGAYLDKLAMGATPPAPAIGPPPYVGPLLGPYEVLRRKEERGVTSLPYLANIGVRGNFPEIMTRFRPAPCFGHNWLTSLPIPSGRKIAEGEFFIGPGGTGYGELHFDRYSLYVATYQLAGEKQWWMYPPSESKYVYARGYPDDWYPHFSPIDPESPDLDRYPLFAKARGLTAVLRAGDVLFCPALWWHNTRNLSTSISIAIRMANRHNFLRGMRDFAVSAAIYSQLDRHCRALIPPAPETSHS